MGVRLQRALCEPQGLSGGQYTVEPDPVGPPRVIICCPVCENLQEIDHWEDEIESDGRVRHAVVCDSGTCPFLEHVELEAWEITEFFTT